ncbi:MAG TPA: sulfate reduction electron transfer complex DsrMKJOP subunit DsrM [Thermodesulfobacteriota bacterium]|nr:sulfate reduction electron transfer complex DsrMKJOP subunit DsrM [Thermodesulfobacteriota bacterium]
MNFILGLIIALVIVHVLVIVPAVGILAANLHVFFGVVVPYAAVTIFLVGLIWRVTKWARSPVPFRIPTTAGQQKTLPWIKDSKLDNPTTTAGVVGRMLLEILLFRSLFRNTRMEYREGPRITYEWEKWLWLFALLFHYSFLVILLRHLRFFAEPVPLFVQILESLDGFAQTGIAPLTGWGLPGLLLSGVVLPGAATLLLLRRLWVPNVRYISLPGDFFPLLLIIGIATTGILMRYVFKLDVVGVKQLMMGLVTFHPVVPPNIGVLFYMHLFLVCSLFAYFPFSKLVHLGGIFLSPTRNLANNNRIVRHVNPWSYPVKVHTYTEYEEEFHDKMVEAGLPVEKE